MAQISTHDQDPNNAPTVWSKGIKGGVITGVVFIIFTLISYVTESTALQSAGGWFSFFALVIGIVLTHRAFKAENGGYMSYGQGLGLGSVLGLVSGALSGIFSFIYLTFVDGTVMERQMDEARLKMEEQGMADAQIDQAMEWTQMFTSPSMILVMGIVGTLIFAFILSLIISAFTKNNQPEQVY